MDSVLIEKIKSLEQENQELKLKLSRLREDMISLGKNTTADANLRQTDTALKSILEDMVLERTKELEKLNTELKNSRKAILNILNDEIKMRKDLEEANWELANEINHRIEIEKIFRQSEERFRKLFEDDSAIKLLIFEKTGEIIDANKAAEKFYGWSKEQLTKMKIFQINTLSEREIKIQMEKAASKKSIYFEFKHRKANGDIADVEVYSSPIKFGDDIYLHSIIIDATQKRQLEKTLKLLNRAVEQNPASIVITDINGDIEYVNPKFTEVTGYKFDEVYRKNPRIWKSGDKTQEEYEKMWKTILSGNIWEGEFLNRKKNGELFWEKAIISPIMDDYENIINFVAVKEDITDKKQMINELVAAKEKAEEINRLKNIFLANMSHELRTPFVGIMGYAGLLSEVLQDDEQKEMADGILRTSKRMLNTLSKILEISKLDSGKTEIAMKQIEVSELVDFIQSEFHGGAVKKGLYLHVKSKKDNFSISCDQNLLESILTNLVSNAIIYTQEGGIEVTFDRKKKGKNEVFVIEISDTGQGIPKDKQEIIWDEFRQASEGSTREFQGTGLGLAIVKKSVELLGGKVYLESEVGKGSVFTVELPIQIDDEK